MCELKCYLIVLQVVLSQGEMMYLPSFWFHYIISQDASIQCNTRSGEATEGKQEIEQCGFSRRTPARRKREVDDKADNLSKEEAEGSEVEKDSSEVNGDNMMEIRNKRRQRRKQKKSKKERMEWNMQS